MVLNGRKNLMVTSLLRVIVVLGLAGPLLLAGIMATGPEEEGKAVFLKRCKMCHGADGKGNPAIARMLKVEFKALDSEYVQSKSDADIKEIITKGTGKMAAVRGATDPEIESVIAYVRSLAKKE